MPLTLARFAIDKAAATAFVTAVIATDNEATTPEQDALLAEHPGPATDLSGYVPLDVMDDSATAAIDQLLYVLHEVGAITGPGRPMFVEDTDTNETHYQGQADIEVPGTELRTRIATTWEPWKYVAHAADEVDKDDPAAAAVAVAAMVLDDLNHAVAAFEAVVAALNAPTPAAVAPAPLIVHVGQDTVTGAYLADDEIEGDDVIVNDAETGEPIAAIMLTADKLVLAWWDEDGEYQVAKEVPLDPPADEV